MARREERALNIKASLEETIISELKKINKAVSRTTKSVERSNKQTERSFKAIGVAVTGITAALVALRGIRAFDGLVEATDRIGKLSVATGVAVEDISELAFIFESAGGSAEQFGSVLSSLLSSQRGAIDGGAAQIRAFQAFGLSIQDLRRLNPAQLLEALADGFDNIKDSTQATLTLTTLFPEQWRNVLNLVRGGGDVFRASLEEARKSGATVTQEQADNAARIVDAQQKLATAVQLVGRVFLETFGPAISNTIEGLARAIALNQDAIVRVAKAALSGLQTILKGTLDAAVFLAELFEDIAAVTDTAAEAFTFGYLRAAEDTREEYEQIEKQIERLNRSLQRYQRIQEEVNAGIRESTDEQTVKRLDTIARRQAEIARLQARADEIRPISASIGNAEAAFDQFIQDLTTAAQTGDDVLAGVGKVIGDGIGQNIDIEAAFASITGGAQAQGRVAADEFVAGLIPGIADATALVGDQALGDQGNLGEKLLGLDFDAVEAGYEKGLQRLTQQINNFSETVGGFLANSVLQASAAMEQAFVSIIDGTKSAKEAWKDFGMATLRIIAQLLAKMIALKITQTVLGLEDGGVLPGVTDTNANLPVRSYARGGVARSPQLAVFGEGNNAEAFVPLPDNRSIPVTLNGGAGMGTSQVNLNVYAWDSRDAARGLVENRQVLQQIFTSQADNLVGMRQTIQRAAR